MGHNIVQFGALPMVGITLLRSLDSQILLFIINLKLGGS